jgi:sugar phosphate isomerase/epimerase
MDILTNGFAGQLSRRSFLRRAGSLAAVSLTALPEWSCMPEPKLFFKISLAEWSFNVSLKAGQMNNLDFPVIAREEFGLDGVEYVNQFFMEKAKDIAYLNELKKRCDDNGVQSLLIMCDEEGNLADTDALQRQQTVENHYKWVDAAHTLGCHSIRVNCAGQGTPEEVAAAGVDGLSRLSAYARQAGLNVIVENHGGYSSNGKWLSSVIRAVSMPNCGTLPDFGNFNMGDNTWYDRYLGVEELMPFAKAVSAKSHDFDDQGNCLETDYARMLQVVKTAGYGGYIGIEYEGTKLSERDGIRATLNLLKRAGAAVG